MRARAHRSDRGARPVRAERNKEPTKALTQARSSARRDQGAAGPADAGRAAPWSSAISVRLGRHAAGPFSPKWRVAWTRTRGRWPACVEGTGGAEVHVLLRSKSLSHTHIISLSLSLSPFVSLSLSLSLLSLSSPLLSSPPSPRPPLARLSNSRAHRRFRTASVAKERERERENERETVSEGDGEGEVEVARG